MAGDGQVSLGQTVVKHQARKIRRLHSGAVLAGFALLHRRTLAGAGRPLATALLAGALVSAPIVAFGWMITRLPITHLSRTTTFGHSTQPLPTQLAWPTKTPARRTVVWLKYTFTTGVTSIARVLSRSMSVSVTSTRSANASPPSSADRAGWWWRRR